MFNNKNNQKNEKNFLISEEESIKMDQEINSHQGILFLVYIFGLLFYSWIWKYRF